MAGTGADLARQTGRAVPHSGHGPRPPGRTRLNVKRVLSCLQVNPAGSAGARGPSHWLKRIGVTLHSFITLCPRHHQASREWQGLQGTESRTTCCTRAPGCLARGAVTEGGPCPGTRELASRGQVRWAGGALGLGSNLGALLRRQAHLGAMHLPSKGVPHLGALHPSPGPCKRTLCVENEAHADGQQPPRSSRLRAGICGRGSNRLFLPDAVQATAHAEGGTPSHRRGTA